MCCLGKLQRRKIKKIGRSRSMAAGTGTLIAAALETAGYYAQEAVLEELSGMIMELATLYFIVAVFVVIFSIMLKGRFESLSWLFIGPAIFYLLIFVRTDSSGAEWQFGNFSDKEDGLNKIASLVPEGKEARVSWVFDRYNQFLSGTFRSIITVITNSESLRAQAKFTARQKIFHDLYSADHTDSSLQTFIIHGLNVKCHEAMEDLSKIVVFNRQFGPKLFGPTGQEILENSSDYQKTMESLNKTFYTEAHNLGNGSSQTYLIELLKRIKGSNPEYLERSINLLCDDPRLDENDKIVEGHSQCGGKKGAVSERLNNESIEKLAKCWTCKEIWCWTAIALREEAIRLTEKIECANMVDEVSTCEIECADHPDSEESCWENTTNDTADQEFVKEIWRDIAIKMGIVHRDDIRSNDKVKEEDLRLIPILISGNILRKSLAKGSQQALYREFIELTNFKAKDYYFDPDSLSEADLHDLSRKANQQIQGVSEKYEIFAFLGILPFIQGCLLCGLSTSFPFFALVVIIPGKVDALFQFFFLFAWVKCFDVCIAFVMIYDDLLWELMPHSGQVNVIDDATMGPLTILGAAFQGDPAYSFSTYTMLLYAGIFGIFSAVTRGLLGVKSFTAIQFLENFKDFGKRHGDTAANFHSGMHTHMFDRLTNEGIAANIEAFKLDSAKKTAALKEGLEVARLAEELLAEGKKKTAEGRDGMLGSGAATTAGIAAAFASKLKKFQNIARGLKILAGAGVGGGVVGMSVSKARTAEGLELQRKANAILADEIMRNATLAMTFANQSRGVRNTRALSAGSAYRNPFYDLTAEDGAGRAILAQYQDLEELKILRAVAGSKFTGRIIGSAASVGGK